MYRRVAYLVALFFAPLIAVHASEPTFGPVVASFDKDGRVVSVEAPGMSNVSSAFAATIEVDGTRQVLSSDSGTSRSVSNSTEMTPRGQAAMKTSTIYFDREQLDLMLRVGDPIAYLNATIACAGTNRVTLEIVSDMSGVQVDHGETRWGQQAILLWERFNAAAALQSEWVAQTHHARTNKSALSGWCSWYLKTSHITGEDVLGLIDAVKESNGRLRPAAIQIDDGYQKIDGVWDANKKFPEGMPFCAQRIAETGARPGLWSTPALPPGGCQHLCLTDLDNQPGQPVFTGSNLHIFCGAAEIKNVETSPKRITIELTDAGARQGDLFIYSKKPPAAGPAAACAVKSVEAVDENVWKIHIEDRESTKPQRIERKIGK